IPTLWLPRYKFGLLPFLVWWLRDDFIRLAAFRPRLLAAAATVGLLLSPLLPDLATSATRHALTFHAGSPLAPILADLPYYPAWMAGLKARLAALNAEGYLALPASGLGFLLHYLTWMGLLLPAGCAAVAAALRPCAGSWRAALLVAGLVAWSCRFAQDMRRDYALFYRAGTTGFAEMTAELKFRLAPGEVLLGRKDFGLYTGRKFYQLYRYGDHGMVADTARLAALLNDGSLRHLVYLEGEPYDDPGFQAFLDRRFEFAHRAGDYVLWKRRPEAARP
ncbi:MAG TPA: hypothetical protein VK465_00060, partial [Fibrobacteria bacterium]|nr:hypothetical protein [Fibrobacteria bacterium]